MSESVARMATPSVLPEATRPFSSGVGTSQQRPRARTRPVFKRRSLPLKRRPYGSRYLTIAPSGLTLISFEAFTLPTCAS